VKTFWIDLLAIALFAFALLFSVMIHELGHFLTARAFGMKVTEFFIGFGKRIWSFRRGETEYGLKAIPAGGYCKISGMSPNEEMPDGEKERAFYLAKPWKRTVVLGAGSFGHMVIGVILLFAIFFGIGDQTLSFVIDSVPKCFQANCANGAQTTPAYQYGLKANDIILEANGKYFTDASQLTSAIVKNVNQPVDFLVKRNNTKLHILVTPVSTLINGKPAVRIGINLKALLLGYHRYNIIGATGKAFSQTGWMIKESVLTIPSIPAKIPGVIKSIFSNKPRDPNGPVGVVGVARIAAQTFADSQFQLRDKISQFLMLMAGLNIFVGIFNLIPLLPLDGGHILVAGIDSYRRRKARRTGVAAKSFDLERLTPLVIGVFVLLVIFALLLVIADLVNPVHI
jgi:membrane-associated protease RseP (regulator of RpoE activity)